MQAERYKLLIVEQHEVNLLICQKMLEEAFQLYHASNLREAKHWMNETKPEAVLWSVALVPHTHLIELLRQEKNWQKAALIALSSFTSPDEEKHFEAKHFDDWYQQPISRKGLIQTIYRGLSKKKGSPSLLNLNDNFVNTA